MERRSIKLKIQRDFKEYTGPRYCSQGLDSGEFFYHTVLNETFYKAISENADLIVDLDDTAGYLSSFLDEAFGNLIFDFSKREVESRLSIISNQEPDWNRMIKEEVFKDWEYRRLNNQQPKKTTNHKAWYRLIGDRLEHKVWISC